MKKNKKVHNLFNKIRKNIYDNLNLYVIISIFLLIGIIAGVIFSNNINNEIQDPVEIHIKELIENLKGDYEIDYNSLLIQTIIKNTLFSVFLWFMGCTVIGIPIVHALVTWKGFSLSYTISTLILCLGAKKGIIFCILSLLLQNIIAIPAIIALAVSGNKLYKSIMKDKRRENIKISIIRHTIFSICMTLVLIISALIEVYISANLTQIYVENFYIE